MSDSKKSSESDMDINTLFNSPPETVPPKKRMVKMTRFDKQDRSVILSHLRYHKEMAKTLTACFKSGPEKSIILPRVPKSKIEPLLKGITKKRVSKSDSIISVNMMDSAQFDEYLKSQLVREFKDRRSEKQLDMITMIDVASELNRIHETLKEDNCQLLRNHLDMGHVLNLAFVKFTVEKRQLKSKETWSQWLQKHTKMCSSYSRRHRDMADLVKTYPGLGDLGLSFTDLFKLKGKILTVFGSNILIGR